MTKLSDLKDKWLQDPEFKSEYDALKPEFELANSFIRARIESGFTQEQVAKKMGTTQSVIARLESGNNIPSMKTIIRYAEAIGRRPQISLIPA